jgi:hypothetical protein
MGSKELSMGSNATSISTLIVPLRAVRPLRLEHFCNLELRNGSSNGAMCCTKEAEQKHFSVFLRAPGDLRGESGFAMD